MGDAGFELVRIDGSTPAGVREHATRWFDLHEWAGGEVLPDVQDRPGRPADLPPHESIEAHLTIVFAALAMSRWIENTTGWSIKRFVTTARRYRTIQIQAGNHTITAADPIPADLHAALNAIHGTH